MRYNTGLTNAELHILREFVSRNMGLHFPSEQFLELERGFSNIVRECGENNPSGFLRKAVTSGLSVDELQIFAQHLTTGETYFYREPERLQTFETGVLPEIIKQKRQTNRTIRLWSAGCSSGEEPYTLAMILRRAITDIEKWNISILATDINPAALKKAEAGIYGNWSFRNTPAWIKDRFFKVHSNGKYQVKDDIKKMVNFSLLNLADDRYPTLFTHTNSLDVVFCRNVLMYFTPDSIKNIIDKFYQSIADEGWFIVSLVESHLVTNPGFHPSKIGESTFFRKTQKHPEQPTPVIHPAEIALKGTAFETYATEDADLFMSLHRLPAENDQLNFPVIDDDAVINEPTEPTLFETALQKFTIGDYDETVRNLADTNELNDPKAMILMARSYANIGRLDNAAEWSGRAVSLDKSNKEFYFCHGTILQETGKFAEAAAFFEKAVYLDPDYVIAHFTLALIARQTGKIKELHRYTRNTIKLLSSLKDDEIIEGSEGLTAGRLREIAGSLAG